MSREFAEELGPRGTLRRIAAKGRRAAKLPALGRGPTAGDLGCKAPAFRFTASVPLALAAF